MLVKPLTSLALCALAVTAALPAHAVPLEASAKTTLVVHAPAAVPAAPVLVRVTHRARRSTKKKVVVRAVGHHAEPARTPIVPAAVLSTPLKVTRVKARSKVVHVSLHPAHVKGEIWIGPKVPAKVEVPAEIEVKTTSRRASVKTRVEAGKVEVKTVKATGGIRPIAQATTVVEAPATGEAHATLDVGTGESKMIATSGSSARPAKGHAGAKVIATKPPCLHEGVEFVRGQEAQTFSLTRCDGSVAPLALEKLSVLARPESAPLPKSVEELAKVKGPDIAAGIRRVDPGLVERIQAITHHFSKSGVAKVDVISGYRPMSSGSYHATGQAMDLRVEGIPNEAVVEFCKTLEDTGCGYYPNSSFVHVDVRQPGTGHVAWIDASGPGEPPKYVATWPPPPEPEVKSADKSANPIDKLDPDLPQLPADDHPAAPGLSAVLPAPLDVAK